jgi:hypothetical protein
MGLVEETACHVMADYIKFDVEKMIKGGELLLHSKPRPGGSGMSLNKRRGIVETARRIYFMVRDAKADEVDEAWIGSLFPASPSGSCLQKIDYFLSGMSYQRLSRSAQVIDKDIQSLSEISFRLIGLAKTGSAKATLSNALDMYIQRSKNKYARDNQWDKYRKVYPRLIPFLCAMRAVKVRFTSVWNRTASDDDIMRVGHYTLTFAETLAPLLPNQKGIAYFNPMFPMKPRGLRIKQHVLVEAKNFIERDIPTVDDAGAVAGGRHETPSGLLGNEFAFSEPIRGDIESNSSKT